MKTFVLFLAVVMLLHLSQDVSAKDYYSIKNGNAADPATWNSSRNGSGDTPAGFNDPSDNFIIQDAHIVTGNNFACKGSLIIETGGTYTTGNKGNITRVGTVVSINDGGIFKLSPHTSLIAAFVLVQGTLENQGGEIKLNPGGTATQAFAYNKNRAL